MTDSENELVKRLRGKIDSLVPRAIAAMFEVQDVVSAVNALEAACRERDEARAERDDASKDKAWALMGRAELLLCAEAAEAEVKRLRELCDLKQNLTAEVARLREALGSIIDTTASVRVRTIAFAALEAKHD